jgi:hypothetical protein
VTGGCANLVVTGQGRRSPRATVGAIPTDDRGPAPVDNLALAAVVAALTLLVAPLWPWSRGWSWAPAGMFAMGLATILLFSYAIVPE